MALDTLEIAKDLRASGFSEEQAEAVTRAVRRSHDADFSNLATKLDLSEVKAELKGDIAELRTELKGDIAALRSEMYRLVYVTSGLQTVVIIGALVALLRLLPR